VTVPITFEDAEGNPDPIEFEVAAGEPTERIIGITHLTITGAPAGTQIGSGAFILDPADFEPFEPAGPGKFQVAAQADGFEFTVTAWAYAQDRPDGACGVGDEYGEYTVGVDATNEIVSVDPAELTLQPDTIDLINAGNLAVCLRVTSPVSGIVRLGAFRFKLSAGTTDTTVGG